MTRPGSTFRAIGAKLKQFLRENDGPTAIEYAVMLALIILVSLTGIALVGSRTSSSFSDSAQQIDEAFDPGE
jgi:pilus assembly protein Flp/PilA